MIKCFNCEGKGRHIIPSDGYAKQHYDPVTMNPLYITELHPLCAERMNYEN